MLFVQFFYAYFVIRQHEYNYHESESSIVFVVSIRASEFASINQSSQTLRVENQHARSILLSNLISNQHARSSSSSQILAFTSTFRNLTSYVSTSIIFRVTKSFFKKLSQYWTKSIRSRRNSRIQTIILTSSWKFSSINVNVSNYHHMRSWKKRHSCLRNVHCFIFMIIIIKTSHSTNFVMIWRNSLKSQNENVSIWRNDKSCTSTTSSSLTRICSWSNVFRSYVLISMTFKKN
jgi:hypothetical protein